MLTMASPNPWRNLRNKPENMNPRSFFIYTRRPKPTVAKTMIPYPETMAVFLPIFYRFPPIIGENIK